MGNDRPEVAEPARAGRRGRLIELGGEKARTLVAVPADVAEMAVGGMPMDPRGPATNQSSPAAADRLRTDGICKDWSRRTSG